MTVPPDTVALEMKQRLFQCALVLSVIHLLMLILGSRFFHLEPSGNQNQPRDMAIAIIKAESPEWAQRWYHWDALWFVHLSRFGYQLERDSEGDLSQSNIAFPPGLSLVIQGLGQIRINPWSGVLMINLFVGFMASLGLGLLAYQITGSQKTAQWSMIALTAWPWHFFMVAPYQESVGMACAFWALYLGTLNRIWPAFILSLISGIFRLNAVGFFGGLILGTCLEMLLKKSSKNHARWIAIGSGPILAWLFLLGYFQFKFGDARIGVSIQTAWGRHEPSVEGLFHSLIQPFVQKMTGTAWLDWFAVWIVMALIASTIWTKLGPVWSMSLIGLLVQSLSTGSVMSFGRLMLLGAPLFVGLGSLAESRPRLALVLSIFSGLIQVLLFWRFGHGQFGG
jgi:hypothetical protein